MRNDAAPHSDDTHGQTPLALAQDERTAAENDNSSEGRIITVLKSSGGCGASMIAANLAGEFCRQSKQPIALVDLDIQFGNLALNLDMRPRHTLLEALQAGKRLDETLLKSLMETHKSGVELLAAPRHMVPLDQIDDEFVVELIRLLKKAYPISVIELPAGWSHWFGPVFGGSDQLVVVCEPTVRGASGLSRVLQSLEDLSFGGTPLCVIANKVQRYGDNLRRVEQLRNTLDRPIEIIRHDEKATSLAVNAGMLLSQAVKRSKPCKDLQAIATRLFTLLDPPAHAAGAQNGKGAESLLPRRPQ